MTSSTEMRSARPDRAPYNLVAIGARDYYQVGVALDKVGRLGKVITDFYTPDSLRAKISKRWTEVLSSRKTISVFPTSILSKLLVAGKANRARIILVDNVFGYISGFLTYFGCNRAIVYSYYLHGFVSFYRTIGKRPDDLICFQVHPSPWFINDLIARDLERFRATGDDVKTIEFQTDIEAEFTESDNIAYRNALTYCRAVICASEVTARSLAVDEKFDLPVFYAPYGSKMEAIGLDVRSGEAEGEPCDRLPRAKIKLLTVCQLTQRKGLHWAFAAMSALPPEIADTFDWVVVSNSIDPAIQALAPSNVRFRSNLSNEEMAELMKSSDLFVLPSILEGFGLVYIESMSMGTPIVYTSNTGAADMCVDGVHGFRVDYSSIEAMRDLFVKIAGDPGVLNGMRKNCRELSAQMNWENFRKCVVGALEPV